MKKIRIIITVLVVSLFMSGMQSCYVDRYPEHRRHWWFHKHDRDQDQDHHHDHDRKGGVIIIKPERRDHDDRDHD